MTKKLLLVFVVLTVVAVAGSSALALTPMGPPKAGLKTGQFRAGVDYSYSKGDIKASWIDGSAEILKDVKSNEIFANVGYGISDNWEAFVRLGAANADIDKARIIEDDLTYDFGFNGQYEFSWGFGTKATLLQQENLSWGTLFQVDWLNTKDSVDGDDVDIDLYQFQIALGPTYKLTDGLSIYGGPFVHLISGSIDWSYADGDPTSKADLRQKSELGGYIGLDADITQNASLYGEFQITADEWAFGTGISWKF
jgi:hypothetical protein